MDTHEWKKSEEKLLEAARKCDSETITGLVLSRKVNVNVADKMGCTAVHLCCKSADLESLALLLEHEARTEIFDKNGMAPFHHAAAKDYVETMALLVSYGADVDVINPMTNMTPLDYAVNNKRQRAIKFLLFCGADPGIKGKDGRVPVLELTKDQADNQQIIRNAYKDRRIQICGKMIKRNEKHSFNVGLRLDNTGKDSKPFSFLCRKMLINFMEIDTDKGASRQHLEKVVTGESGEIISDVYDYLVNQTVHGVTMSVQVYTVASRFDAVVLRDSTGEEFKCNECVQDKSGVFYTFVLKLKANEDQANTFAVVVVPKKDSFMTTVEQQTIRSTVDPKFGVKLPDKCLPRNSKVELQMFAVIDYAGGMNTEYVVGMSNLCSVNIDHRNRRAITVTVPLPDRVAEQDQETNHTVFYADEGAHSQWKEMSCSVREEDKQIDVTEPSVSNGTYIGLVVHKKRRKDFLDHVLTFLRWLYKSATGRLKPCCFYGMSRFCSGDICKVLIGVADDRMADSVINKWRKDNFVSTLSQKTATHLFKSNSHFSVVAHKEVCVKGMHCQRLVYQSGREAYEEFLVSGKEHEVAQFMINQISKEVSLTALDKMVESNTCKCVAQMNVELLRERESPEDSKAYQQFTEYPDSRFLMWLAGQLGNEWMMVGIGLGQNYSFLERIEQGNDVKRAIQLMLYRWRGEADPTVDLGLTPLIHSLTKVGRKDLVSEINRQLLKLLKEKPKERVVRWVTSLTSGLDDVDAGPTQKAGESSGGYDEDLCISCLIEEEKVPSPFTEAFLLGVVCVVGSNLRLLAQLNLPQSTVDGVRQSVQDPVSAMFKCLLIAWRNYEDVVSFFDDLLTALQTDHNLDAVFRIKQAIRKWYLMGQNSLDKDARRLGSVLEKY